MGKKSRITPATRDCLNTLALRIKGAKQVVAFTGAGISTESGIPDYRSQGGLWDQFKPIFFDEFLSSKTARIKYWNQHLAMEKSLRHARPNKGHKALARLERRGFLSCIITQNIDGLHQASGIPPEKIIELHGNARKIACMSCAKQFTWDRAIKEMARGNLAPECSCGGYLKPNTISFGQAMPEIETAKAATLSSQSDVFIVIGSTLRVQPAASMPERAKSAGAFLVIITLSDTPFDKKADMVIREKAGPVLDALACLVTAKDKKL